MVKGTVTMAKRTATMAKGTAIMVAMAKGTVIN